MSNLNNVRSDNEKLAAQVTDMDKAEHFVANDETTNEYANIQNTMKFNQAVGDLQEKFQEHVDALYAAGEKIAADMNNLEIMPLSCYALISPFAHNPFQKISFSSSGKIITDLGGLAPTYKNQENGQIEEEKEFIKVGMVTEVGTECKFLKPGDIVFYNITSEVPVPFFKFGFVIVAEQRVIAVVNEGLTQRKDDIVKNKTQE